ncbi:rCG49165 [Rattus norvegicus]|uniref:RCG49165 n=1 Tax=Rattus norvegicus TaxID=10116 RepID=A6IGH3_RAT|nr:rCG49165 [Rattus norvegicus]
MSMQPNSKDILASKSNQLPNLCKWGVSCQQRNKLELNFQQTLKTKTSLTSQFLLHY